MNWIDGALFFFISFTVPTILVLTYSAKYSNRSHLYFLAGALLSMILYLMPFVVTRMGLLADFPFLLRSGNFFFSLSPVFLLFFHEILLVKGFTYRRKHLMLLFIPLFFLGDYFYFHLGFAGERGNIIDLSGKNVFSIIAIDSFFSNYWYFPLRFFYLLSFFIYFGRSYLQRRKRRLISPIELDILQMQQDCFNILFHFCFLLLVTSTGSFLFNGIPIIQRIENYYFALILGATAVVCGTIFFKPRLLYELRRSPASRIRKKETAEDAADLLKKVEYTMQKEKYYLNPDFSAAEVMTQFGTSRSHLDAIIMQLHNITFADWLNRYRVEYAKALMPENRKLTIDSVAQLSGFSSRSAFYVAFKKICGCTPTNYLKSLPN